MKPKVVELLMLIMAEIQDEKRLSELNVADFAERGYTQSEINAALSWLIDSVQTRPLVPHDHGIPGVGSHRVFHETERAALSTESQGYLLQLLHLGLLTERDLEAVIDRVMLAGGEKVYLDDVRTIVTAVLLSKAEPPGMPGNSLLNNEDTIH